MPRFVRRDFYSSSTSLKNYPFLRQFLAETFGTFVMMVFGLASVAQAVLSANAAGSHMSIYWAWGLGVAIGVSISIGSSGGHLNPAVTVAMATLGRVPWKRIPLYFLGQYLGSFLASVVVYLVYMDALDHFDGGTRQVTGPNGTASIWATYPQPFVSTWTGLGDQILGTSLLLVCVMTLTDSSYVGRLSVATPFYIGTGVVAIGCTLGFNCGYAINPARDLAPRIFTAMAGWGSEPFSFRNYNWFWVPIVGPHIGAVLGAHLYQFAIGLHWPDQIPVDQYDEAVLAAANQKALAILGELHHAAELIYPPTPMDMPNRPPSIKVQHIENQPPTAASTAVEAGKKVTGKCSRTACTKDSDSDAGTVVDSN